MISQQNWPPFISVGIFPKLRVAIVFLYSKVNEKAQACRRRKKKKNTQNFHNIMMHYILKKKKKKGFPGGSNGKESAGNGGDPVRSLGQEDPLEKGMATHSSILAWRIS